MVKLNEARMSNGKTNTMSAGLQTGTRAPEEALRALARLSGEPEPPETNAPVKTAPAPAGRRMAEEDFDDGTDDDDNDNDAAAPAAKPVRRPAKAAKAAAAEPSPGRPLSAERPLSFQVTMNPRELRKQLGVRVLQSIQMRLKKAAILGQLSGEGPQTAQEIVEAALGEYLDKLGH